ncbi:MAG: spore cortex biosynthesis protein YabQ [Oscillospiraceae bacterium]
MSLHPLAQLGQVALALGLGAALGLLFDVLRVPRRHARRAFLRAVLDAVFCLAVGLTVFAFGMAAGSGQVRLFMFLAIAAGWTGYFAWVSGQVLPPLEQFSRRCAQKNAPICRPRTEICKKSLDFCKKTLPKSPQMF